MCNIRPLSVIFFFNDTATTEIYTLSLHDALPIYHRPAHHPRAHLPELIPPVLYPDQKSTRLNSSHLVISYAVFCLKKKNDDNFFHFIKPKNTIHSIILI